MDTYSATSQRTVQADVPGHRPISTVKDQIAALSCASKPEYARHCNPLIARDSLNN